MLPFLGKTDLKKEENVISFALEQNIICSRTQLDDIAYEQIIVCWQLFAGHVLGSPPMKRKTNLHRIINNYYFQSFSDTCKSVTFLCSGNHSTICSTSLSIKSLFQKFVHYSPAFSNLQRK